MLLAYDARVICNCFERGIIITQMTSECAYITCLIFNNNNNNNNNNLMLLSVYICFCLYYILVNFINVHVCCKDNGQARELNEPVGFLVSSLNNKYLGSK